MNDLPSVNRGVISVRRPGAVGYAWAAILALCCIGALYLGLYRWAAARATNWNGDTMPWLVGFMLDELVAAWISVPYLLGVAFITTIVVTVRRLIATRLTPVSGVRRGLLVTSAIAASIGTLAIVALLVPPAFAAAMRMGMCETTTFEQSISPNGRYRASVSQIDCGAMSSFNRQVIVTRLPFTWASQSILFFKEQPSIHLSWDGRMLTIQGEESPQILRHPPPDPLLWGGILARYVGPSP